MKTLTFIATILSLHQAVLAQIELRSVSESAQEGYKATSSSFLKWWEGDVLLKLPKPASLELEERLYFSVKPSRELTFSQMPHDFLIIPVPQNELKILAAKLPADKTSQLAVYIDGTFIAFTPRTRDWARWGVTATNPSELGDADIDKVRKLGIKVTGAIHEFINAEDIYKQAVAPHLAKRGGGAIVDMILNRKILDNPLKSEVTVPSAMVFQQEPAKVSVKYSNVGVDQSAFCVSIRCLNKFRSCLRPAKDTIFALSPAGKPAEVEVEHKPLLEGETFSASVNLTRELGLEYQRLGTGKAGLQLDLDVGALIEWSSYTHRDINTWMDLPAPEIKVVAFAESEFKEQQRADLGGGELLRLGTHKLGKEEVTVVVFAKGREVKRMLRLDPPPGVTAWDIKWDAGKKQAHIVATGPKSRYWVTAVDRLDFEVRLEVPSTSKLEVKDGGVRRVE